MNLTFRTTKPSGTHCSTQAVSLLLVTFAAVCAVPTMPALAQAAPERADLRVYGTVSTHFSPGKAVFACADARHADILMGKLLADLFWDAGSAHQVSTVAAGNAKVQVHSWPPYGVITVAGVGAQVIALGADTADQLLTAVNQEPRLLTAAARYAPADAYPCCLDFYDLRGFKAYDHAMRSALDQGLENHWPFVKQYGLGGLAFQTLGIGKSTAAPGATDWAAMDYEMREAEKQRGMAVVGFSGGGEMPLWMFNRCPESAMAPSPHALIGAWGGAGAAGGHYESWSIPREQAESTSLAFLR